MLLIEDIVVSETLFQTQFVCNLDACKGACCWEGDWGAPLETQEIEQLQMLREKLRPYLTEAGNEVIDEVGSAEYFKEPDKFGTPLIKSGACAYLTYDQNGIGKCGIEKAHEEGATNFRKPISCHLYPLRYEEDERIGFRSLNYDVWDICNAACHLGDRLQIPLYQFVKEGLIRKFGVEFYQALDEVAHDLTE